MLVVDGICAAYGAVPALTDVSLTVDGGEVVALLGANGSGRTTLLRVLAGLLRTTAGRVLLDGAPLEGAAHGRAGRGLALVPEGRHVFGRLSVLDNLRVGARTTGPQAVDEVLVRLPELAPFLRRAAGTLSGGEQQLLALGRALASRPRLLLLDEPTTGLAPQVVERVLTLVTTLAAEGLAVLLVEQDLGLALGCAARGVVLEGGRVVVQGPAEGLAGDPRVEAAYLGGLT